MKKISFIGPPGSGKSTLTTDVYTSLKQNGVNAELVSEWVRTDIQSNGPIKSIWEQYRVRQHQKELEDAVPSTVDFLICDSGTLTSYFYACLYADHADSRQRLVLQDMYRYMINDLYLKRYDAIFYLSTKDLQTRNLDDGIRFQTEDELILLEQHMDLTFCKLFKPGNVFKIDGPFNSRLEKVMTIIAA